MRAFLTSLVTVLQGCTRELAVCQFTQSLSGTEAVIGTHCLVSRSHLASQEQIRLPVDEGLHGKVFRVHSCFQLAAPALAQAIVMATPTEHHNCDMQGQWVASPDGRLAAILRRGIIDLFSFCGGLHGMGGEEHCER